MSVENPWKDDYFVSRLRRKKTITNLSLPLSISVIILCSFAVTTRLIVFGVFEPANNALLLSQRKLHVCVMQDQSVVTICNAVFSNIQEPLHLYLTVYCFAFKKKCLSLMFITL